ncbi:hypothetical protein JOQ06_007919 [Pogonophryne albipinna]|uniref:Uncharacterized protein n=1 Tax=Pogonophryne albipinna TaxID=1090488 RepID=A0AAD6F398_9TELE|nr:hypothetical protein JOQ06_007919 [Pogonophryne albipinna]
MAPETPPGSSMGSRTRTCSTGLMLLVASTLVSMVTPSSPAAGMQDLNRTFDSPPPSDQDSGTQGIHLLLRPPDLLSPSLPPPLPPHIQPSLTPPPPWEHGPSLEEAWGSGDYLETLSFMVPEEEELSSPHPEDQMSHHGGVWVSYDSDFPSRSTLPLSPSSPTAPLQTRPSPPDLFPSWDEDYDLDLTPLEPTELLLPDMNSLEYYTNLQENPPITTVRTTSAPQPRDRASIPGRPRPRPPSNTTGRVPPPPPLGPPTRPDRPERPPTVTEKPLKGPPTTTKATTTTTRGTTTTRRTTTTKGTTTTQSTAISLTRGPPVTTPRVTPPTRQYLCNVTKPEMYLVRVVSSKGSSSGFSAVRDLLKREFNRSVELQFLRTPSSFAFRVVSGPLIFTAVSVVSALRRAPRGSGPVPSVAPLFSEPDLRYQVHSVLQFVPEHVDVRVCSFSQRVERGLVLAYTETRRRHQEAGNISVQLLNITTAVSRPAAAKVSVDITFAVRDGRGFLLGSEVSEHLRKLSPVEFSFYIGFPALQIAEPFHYPELNTSHHLRSTWVRTVLLGVQEQTVSERSFKARLERRLALLLEESQQVPSRGRWRRASAAGNSSLQVVRVSLLSGPQRPLEVFYFVEGPGGDRVLAETTSLTLNRLDLQRAAIVLGHRVQRPLAQPVELLSPPPAETQSSSVWLIVGVLVPVLLALFIIVLLYWKLCGSEKLEFQPDAINTIQQRQKLQAPSVKGFDFAKLHLGQHKATPSDGGDLNTPKSKGSSTKVPRSSRRRGRLSPSDGDSLGSDQSSGRESAEESTRAVATPSEGKHRKTPKNGQRHKMGSAPDELLSSSSIFDHVDRLSRGSSDGTRRQNNNKVQLIAMQPRPPQPHLSPSLTERVSQEVALRHKSEIEHHRNKLRQRAKRRGQCDFPSMDDIMDAFGEGPVQSAVAQRLYSSAHDHMDCILQADTPHTPPDSRRRGRRSPRGRRSQPGPGSLPDTDRDRLLTDHSATYRKYPGLNNVAYMSDPDLPPDHGSPSPTDEPSIEEARQQMLCLLDDAFALVSPSSGGSGGVSGPSPRPPYSAASPHSPFSARYAELGMSPTSMQNLLQRQGLSSGGFVSTGEQDSVYSSRGQYEDPPSSSRPRPVGGSTGAQLHHLTQVGLSSQIGVYPGVGRSMSGPTGSSWNQQHSDQDLSRSGASRESVLSFPEFSSSSVFHMPSSSLRDPLAPPLLLTSPTPEYPPEDASPSAHTSASLIKAIREELRRLAQKQVAVTSYP